MGEAVTQQREPRPGRSTPAFTVALDTFPRVDVPGPVPGWRAAQIRALRARLGWVCSAPLEGSRRRGTRVKAGPPCTVGCMDAGDASSGVRLAELVVALSLATDLGLGQPQEHVLRQTVIARRLAAAAGLPDEQQAAVFYVSLLAWVGCVSDSHEMAAWFGDDRRFRADSYE